MKYRLGNLTQETTYRVSLVGVTRVGEGPEATVTINTLPEKPVNGIKTALYFCIFSYIQVTVAVFTHVGGNTIFIFSPKLVLWKLCLLFLFVILTTMCTCILKR